MDIIRIVRVGYEYYPNPTYIFIKIKNKNSKPLSPSLTLSLPFQTRAIDLLSSLPNPSKHVSWLVIAALIHHVYELLILAVADDLSFSLLWSAESASSTSISTQHSSSFLNLFGFDPNLS